MNYPVLSLSPPYGTLIQLLLKKIETRGRQTSYRGPLLIHQTAAPGPKGTTEAQLWDLCLSKPFRAPLLEAGYGSPARLPRGKIIALVELHNCVSTDLLAQSSGAYKLITADECLTDGKGNYYNRHFVKEDHGLVWPLTDQERAFGDYTPGRWAWLLDNVRPLPRPIAARGMPGLWRWEGDLGV